MRAPTGLRERKKTETRQAISAAALELAIAHGPGAVTVEDIAAAANVSARTVFNYFPTKEAAILGMDPHRRLELIERLEDRPADEPPLVAVRETFRGLFSPEVALLWRRRAALVRDHPQMQSAYLAGFSGFEDDLTAAIARRTGRDAQRDPYCRLLVAVAGTAMRVAVDHAIASRRTAAIGEAIDDAFATIAAGFDLTSPAT
ncbi:MAG: transcriptional regulator, TetR family [Acidimicrobiales bacterium]|nr:transcriptional regulator, TetR family [Acidimicrobiales bacterium]